MIDRRTKEKESQGAIFCWSYWRKKSKYCVLIKLLFHFLAVFNEASKKYSVSTLRYFVPLSSLSICTCTCITLVNETEQTVLIDCINILSKYSGGEKRIDTL